MNKNKFLIVSLVLIGILGIGGFAFGGDTLKDLIADKIADRLTPQLQAELGLSNELGLTIPETATTGLTNVRLSGKLTLDNVNVAMDMGSLDAADGEFKASFQNTTGGDVFVEYTGGIFDGTASSTFEFNIATSTYSLAASNTWKNSDADLTYSGVIDSLSVPTSTIDKVFSIDKDKGTNGQQMIKLADDEWVNLILTNPYQNGCTGSLCESASSTARGFDIDYMIRYFWF